MAEIFIGNMQPYTDSDKINNSWRREFLPNVESSELVWHRDKKDRVVEVISGEGWMFQLDNDVPFTMEHGMILNIPKEKYHRLYKSGNSKLVIRISE